MTTHKSFISAILGFAALITGGCTSLDCSIENTVAMNVAIPDTLSDDTLSVFTKVGDRDTTLYNRGYGITTFSIPVSYDGEVEELYLAFSDTTGTTLTDTLTIEKTNEPHFESVDCTPQFWHTILGVSTTHHRLDSAVVTNNFVNNDPSSQHISLYLRTR